MTRTHYLARDKWDADTLFDSGDPAVARATKLAMDWIAAGKYPEITPLDALVHGIYFTGPDAALDALEDAVADAMAGGRVEWTCARCHMDFYHMDVTEGLCRDCLAEVQGAIRNLTPHPITILVGADPAHPAWSITLPPSGLVARVAAHMEDASPVFGIPVVTRTLGQVIGLPAPKFGYYYLVSSMVADAATNRHDLLVPGELVRDDQGNPIGCRGLARVH